MQKNTYFMRRAIFSLWWRLFDDIGGQEFDDNIDVHFIWFQETDLGILFQFRGKGYFN